MMQVYTNEMLPKPARILKIYDETPDTKTFILENITKKIPKPGQFYMISVFGVGEFPVSVGYADENNLLITVKKVGQVTGALFELGENDIVGLRGPYGNGFPIEEFTGKNIVLIGGGIGIPPLRSVIEYIFQHRNEFGYVQLLYGARSPKDIVYKDKLLKDWPKIIDVKLTVDVADETWKGHVGVVTTIFDQIKNLDSIFLIVGPEVMMKYSVLELKKRGVKESQIYLSLERKMKCGIGICGHCNLGRFYVCKDGPVFRYDIIANERELFYG